ncbi:MAG: hypothetical protein BGO55_15800 [Sphingobacteriales bacterium 50-39]|nr:MAG: hypothetical protein BGO55_15800 [Sphingobacteriales bacterium 50-39]
MARWPPLDSFFYCPANHTALVLLKYCQKGFSAPLERLRVIHIIQLWHNLWLISFQKNDNKGLRTLQFI